MKFMLFLVAVLVAFLMGYMIEPTLRPAITAKPQSRGTTADPVIPRELKTITLTGQVAFYDNVAGRMVNLTPGTEVKLLRVEDGQAIIMSTESNNPISIDISLTSLAAPPPEPEPEPEPEPVVAEVPEPDELVKIMQQSIRDEEIGEFQEDQVREWTAGPEEIHDGETYQTGTALYDKQMLFGDKTLKAKALIKDGKVVRWLWPDLGMDIQ